MTKSSHLFNRYNTYADRHVYLLMGNGNQRDNLPDTIQSEKGVGECVCSCLKGVNSAITCSLRNLSSGISTKIQCPHSGISTCICSPRKIHYSYNSALHVGTNHWETLGNNDSHSWKTREHPIQLDEERDTKTIINDLPMQP